MALSRNYTTVTSSSNAAISVAYNNTVVASDAITWDSTDVAASLQVQVTNGNGTPVTGDNLEVYAAYTNGDVAGDTGDDFDTTEHATFIGVLDTYPTDTPGENPARKTLAVSVMNKGVKFLFKNIGTGSASSTMTVRAILCTQRAA